MYVCLSPCLFSTLEHSLTPPPLSLYIYTLQVLNNPEEQYQRPAFRALGTVRAPASPGSPFSPSAKQSKDMLMGHRSSGGSSKAKVVPVDGPVVPVVDRYTSENLGAARAVKAAGVV